MLSCPIFKTNQIQNVSLDTIRPLLPSQHRVVPSKGASRRRCEFRRLLFGPEDVVILANPTSCLNDMCINGCITLLFSSIKPPNSRHFAAFSTYDLLRVRYNALTDPYGKGHGTPRSELNMVQHKPQHISRMPVVFFLWLTSPCFPHPQHHSLHHHPLQRCRLSSSIQGNS